MHDSIRPGLTMLIKTSGLEYDDRLRKECMSAVELGYSVQVCAVQQDNKATCRAIYGGAVAAETHSLLSRRVFPQRSALWVKIFEMTARFLLHVARRRPSVVWCHNIETMMCLPALLILRRAGVIERLIWDQHELPPNAWLVNGIARWLFMTACNGCDAVICANEYRREYLSRKLSPRLTTQLVVLDNFPDSEFASLARARLPEEADQWLQGCPYVLAQGGGAPNRRLEQLVEAVLLTDHLKLIVIGPVDADAVNALARRYGTAFADRVLFTGWVPQMDIAPYIDRALASVVLYGAIDENMRLCAPNRLYQAVCRGTPVVVGANPPMAAFVTEAACGVVLADDGQDVVSLKEALETVAHARDMMAESAGRVAPGVSWQSQRSTIARVLGL